MKTYTELADLTVSIYDKIEHGKIRGAVADLEAIQLDAFKAGAEWAAGVKAKYKLPKGRCKQCGKVTSLRAPTGNYLDALFPRKHRDKDGSVCEGTWSETEPLQKDEE
jgi:hypothetical protein